MPERRRLRPDALAVKTIEAAALDRVIGGVCHGPLGLGNVSLPDGRPLVDGRRVSAVTDTELRELGIARTPHHPETELRRRGVRCGSATAQRDVLANHWAVDGNVVTHQNAGPVLAREMMRLVTASAGSGDADGRRARIP